MSISDKRERVARIVAHAAADWTDMQVSEHLHGPDCANWQGYLPEADQIIDVCEGRHVDQ